MSESFKLIAGNSFPTVTAHLLDGTTADLSKPHGGAEWQMLVVYRGKHCPLCMRYLNLLEAQLPALKALGVSVCAVSADTRAQLTQS
ncbi:MAG: redoxin family protein, partial [Pseudomonadota bacterium]|nr:redoxin family protein [Pseudomonadota bacterium]